MSLLRNWIGGKDLGSAEQLLFQTVSQLRHEIKIYTHVYNVSEKPQVQITACCATVVRERTNTTATANYADKREF